LAVVGSTYYHQVENKVETSTVLRIPTSYPREQVSTSLLTPVDTKVTLTDVTSDLGNVTITAGSTTTVHSNVYLTDVIASPAGTTTIVSTSGDLVNGVGTHLIQARNISLTAGTGVVGAAGAVIRTDLTDGVAGKLDTASAGSVFVTETSGDLRLGAVSSNAGDVTLVAAGAILDFANDAASDVDGRNVTLTATAGGIGILANPLDVNTAVSGLGIFKATATNDVFVTETTGDLTLDVVSSTTGGVTLKASAGSLVDTADSGAADVIGTYAVLSANANVGSAANPLDLQVSKLESAATGGGVWIGNSTGLTIGGASAVVGISAQTDIVITAAGPVTVTEDVISTAGSAVLTATDTASAGQDLIVTGGADIRAASAGQNVTLLAGDNFRADADSLLQAGDQLAIRGDFGNADPGVGTTIEVFGSLQSTSTAITAGADVDTVHLKVQTISGATTVLTQGGTDAITVTELPNLTTTHSGVRDTVTLDGGAAKDTYTVYVHGASDYVINVRDSGASGDGADTLDILGRDQSASPDFFLLRKGIVAAEHGNYATRAFTAVERINYDGAIDGGMTVLGRDGDDKFHSDDNATTTVIDGGKGNDFFQVGQLFGTKRDAGAATGIAPGDEFETLQTTRGYLSNGVSFATTIRGGEGNDQFSTYHNKAALRLEGNAGNDEFVVRAFAEADPTNPTQPKTTVDAGTGQDVIQYAVNAQVDIDGGDGFDKLVVLGTEFGDSIDVSDVSVTGAGLTVAYNQVESVEVDGLEGDDQIFVHSTRATAITRIIGGLGNDTITVAAGSPGSPAVPHTTSTIRGPLFVEGGVGPTNRAIVPAVTLPNEIVGTLPPPPNGGNESQSTDKLFVLNDDSTLNDTGILTPTTITGLNMGTGLTVDEGTPGNPDIHSYPGGVTYTSFETVDVLLGSGKDDFLITGTATGVVTTLHAGGGDDTIRVKAIGGVTTILGQAGDDLVQVASDAITVDQIAALLTVDGGSNTVKDVLTVDDAGDTNNNSGEMTSSTVTGLDMAGSINYVALEELHVNLGSGNDTFRVRGTHGTTPTTVTGGAGNDLIRVGQPLATPPVNPNETLADVQGTLTVDAGIGTNQLRVTDTGGTTPKHVAVTDHSILGFAPADIFYSATGGKFDKFNTTDPYAGTGVWLEGSKTARDAFLVQSTLGGSTTAIAGGGGGDVYYLTALPPVASGDVQGDFPVAGPLVDNGNVDTIQGRLRVVAPTTGTPSQLYVNDHGKPGRANYTVSPAVVQNFLDTTNPVPARPQFAGIDYQGAVNELRLDATDDVNVFDAKPGLVTHYTIDGNLPVGGVPIVGGGDYLRLDKTGTTGRKLHITSLGTGYWQFTTKHKPVNFESIERFNHVDIVAYQGDVGLPSQAPLMTVRDAENGVKKFGRLVYESNFRGAVRWAAADMNWDGIPDLITVTGAGRAAEVHIYNGTPDAAGKYAGQEIASFPVLPTGVHSGAFLAVGDVNHDGANDIVTAADAGWLPQVRVWDGLTARTTHTELVDPFMAFPTTFRGGVRVAVGDLDETDGSAPAATAAEIILAPGKGASPTVGIYAVSGHQLVSRRKFTAFPPGVSAAGLFVAVGDYNGDHVRDVIVSPGAGTAPKVNIFSGIGLLTRTGLAETPKWSVLVQPINYRGGISVTPVPKNGGNPFSVEWVTLRYNLGPR